MLTSNSHIYQILKQLVTYIGLAYILSWSIWLPMYGHVFGWNDMPVLPLNHAIGGLGPLIASFLTTWIFLGKSGVIVLFARCLQIKPFLYLVIALCSPFILAILAALISSVITKQPLDFSGILNSKEFPKWSILTIFIYNLVFFGFGEEVGWRGFALPRLQFKVHALSASILLTVIWALWHLPLFFYRSGYTTMEWTGILGWVFSLLTGSILLTWLYNSSRASILICAVFHSTIDIAFTANFANQNMMNYLGFLITIWGILTIIFFKTKNLSTVPRETTISG